MVSDRVPGTVADLANLANLAEAAGISTTVMVLIQLGASQRELPAAVGRPAAVEIGTEQVGP